MLDAERNVYLAARNYATARYSYIANYLILRQAAGQLSEQDIVEINGWLGAPRPTSGAAAATSGPEPVKTGSGKDKKGRKDQDKDKNKPATTKPAGKESAAPVASSPATPQ